MPLSLKSKTPLITKLIRGCKMEGEIGRIKKSEAIDVVVIVDEFDGKEGVTIREFVTSETYTGFTKKGTRIPKEKWAEFKEVLDGVKF